MKLGLWDYIRAAFNARPIGMFVPPNWIGLGGVALFGLLNPGVFLLGAGMELMYLFVLAHNPRFQRVVNARQMYQARQQWQDRLTTMVSDLSGEDQRRYRALEQRCQTILQQQGVDAAATPDLQTQGEGLGRLLWMYLRLLLTRQSINRILRESSASVDEHEPLGDRIEGLQAELKKESLGVELRKSLSGQLEILQQRMQSQKDARQKLEFLEAELTRIQEQIELIREQSVFSTDPAAVSQRIDQIAASLGETGQWIRDQQQIYGKVDDLLAEPPPITLPQAAKEAQ
jgi:hypothetical protein